MIAAPYKAIASLVQVLLVFLSFYEIATRSAGWFIRLGFGGAAIFRFILFFQGFHNCSDPFHRMGVAGVLGRGSVMRYSGCYCRKYVDWRWVRVHTGRAVTHSSRRNFSWSPLTALVQILGLFVPVTGLWMSALGVVGLALNRRPMTSLPRKAVQRRSGLIRGLDGAAQDASMKPLFPEEVSTTWNALKERERSGS
ncbi:hypothetical protein HID58_094405 [Brassica napus]|uniref:Uncharacterized protein n=1 Tax=Brassica napus TaxID=3708 RepID=A0ABQ7X9W3_BRANA|nr:hypothetical protein HID58_094405 [Brassica napus]